MSPGPELPSKVLDWLQKEGYPLEFQAKTAFEDAAFKVEHGSFIRDPLSRSLREVDLLAYTEQRAGNVILRITFVVSCKSSVGEKPKPWLVFCSGSNAAGAKALLAQTIATPLGTAALVEIGHVQDVRWTCGVFAAPSRGGFSAVQAFKNRNEDEAYKAIAGLVNVAVGKIVRPPNHLLELVFPVLVVNTPVFEVWTSKGDELELEQVDSSILRWHGSETCPFPARITIVNSGNLQPFARRVASDALAVINELSPHAPKLYDRSSDGSLWKEIDFQDTGLGGMPHFPANEPVYTITTGTGATTEVFDGAHWM